MKHTEFTGETKVWLSSPQWQSLDRVHYLLGEGKNKEAVDYLTITNSDMSTEGWAEVGTATMSVKLHSADAVLGNQIAALNQELQTCRANAQLRENEIMDKISKLQALTYEAPQT